MRRRISTRRGRAVKSLCLLAVSLLVLITLGRYGLTPAAALRQSEGVCGTGRTQVLWRRDLPPDWWRADRLTLSANDGAVLFSVASYDWRWGWQDGDCLAVDCTGSGSLHGDVFSLSDGAGGAVRYLFGRVDDLSAARVEAAVYAGPGETECLAVFTTERRDWLWRDGRACFLLEISQEEWPPVPDASGEPRLCLTAWDTTGNQLERQYMALNRATRHLEEKWK